MDICNWDVSVLADSIWISGSLIRLLLIVVYEEEEECIWTPLPLNTDRNLKTLKKLF